MPGYTARRAGRRPQREATESQQANVRNGSSSEPLQQSPQQGSRGRSRGASLSAAGAKRKRMYDTPSGTAGTQQEDGATVQTASATSGSVVQTLASDQHKAQLQAKSPAKSPAKPRRSKRTPKPRHTSSDSEFDPEDEVPIHGLAQKTAVQPRRQVQGKHTKSGQPATSQQRDAAAAAFFGSSTRWQGGPSASTSVTPGTIAAQPPAAPSGGLAGLVSRVSNAARQSGSRPSSAGASLQYMFHKQQRDYAKLIQQNELILAEAPFYDVAKSGVASFAYFEPGFMTQPFSVSAYAKESKAALSRLEEFVLEANNTQMSGVPVEAASLRVPPLEEQQQAAIQASKAAALLAAESEGAKVPTTEPAKKQTRQRPPPAATRPPARSAAATASTGMQSAPQPASKPTVLMSLVSGLMPPPPPRPPAYPAQAPTASCAPAVSRQAQSSASNGASSAAPSPIPESLSAGVTPKSSLAQLLLQQGQARKHSSAEQTSKGIPTSASTSISARASGPAVARSNSGPTGAAACSVPPGLPVQTADVCAKADALIASLGAACSDPCAPASATDAALAAAQAAASAAAATAGSAPSGGPAHAARQTSADSAPSHQQAQQSQPGTTGAARPALSSRQPQPVPPVAAALQGTAAASGQAALAAMPLIQSPPADGEDLLGESGSWRRRRGQEPPQSKSQAEHQEKLAQEVKRQWQQGLDDAAQDLASIKVTCTFQSDAGRRRWERNVAADASNRISQAEAFAQRGQAAPHIQRAGALAEADIGSAQCQPAIQPEAEDTVLTFTVHRFDRPGKVLASVAVLGKQKLTVLRDSIRCEADASLTKNKQQRPSACFYFEGVFYVDMRDASAVDMSVPIKEFCQNQNVGVPAPAPSNPPAYPLAFHKATQHDRDSEWQPRSVKMEDFTFNDLFLRVGQGAGYVYMHQGCCEHLVELSDVRSVHHAELLESRPTLYPLVLKEAMRNRRGCVMCTLANLDRRADWVTYSDKNAPTSPAFWCEDCYKTMHLNAKSDKCYDFLGYEYAYEIGNLKRRHRTTTATPDTPDDIDDLEDLDEGDEG